MRWTALFLLPMLAGAVGIGGSEVRTVYVTPMAHGLDQYIANQLTREHVLDVTADPARADAIFTDRLGQVLQDQLEKLHPTPKPPDPKPAAEGENTDSAKSDSAKSEAKDKPAGPKTIREPDPPHVSTFGRAKGTLFLVDARSRVVLWSLYEKPVTSSPRNLDSAAKRVIAQLKKDLADK